MRLRAVRSPAVRTASALGALLIAGSLGVAPSAGAQEPVSIVELEDDSGYSGQLGVDARGGAVAAWRGDSARLGALVDVSLRRPTGAFGASRRVTATDTARFRLAVGPRGDAAVVLSRWERELPLMVARARAGQRFGAPVALPAFASQTEAPAAAIDARGTLLVAWLQRSGRKGCGRIVMATILPAGRGPGAPRRVSPPCPDAALVRVALARNGDGAVAWRSARRLSAERSRYGVQVSTYVRGRFAPPRTVSTGPVWYGQPALAAGGDRALVAWRAQARVTRGYETHGRVLVAAIDGARIGRPVAISASDRVQGDVYAAMSPADAAIVSWVQVQRGDSGARVAVRRARSRSFLAPEVIAACASGGTLDGSGRGHLDSAARVALDGRGRALAIFGDGCVGGLGAARRTAGGTWQPAFAVGNAGEQARPMFVGVSDAGDGVAAWSTPQLHPESVDGAIFRAAVLPATGAAGTKAAPAGP